jgi:transcription initiation factor TFIIIB Brf1 subunit/transcription initiation factor TFIIB
MEKIKCPYCDVEVRMEDVDNEGGACPECGAMVTGSLLFGASSDGYDESEFDSDFVEFH